MKEPLQRESRQPNQAPSMALTPCGRTRREFFWQAGGGFVGTALAWMLAQDRFFQSVAQANDIASLGGEAIQSPLAPKPSHLHGKAKACICLFNYGGPSQV